MKKLGKGMFTTAYLLPDGRVKLKSCDPIKECMALGWFPNHRLFPKIERGDEENVYFMDFYERPKSLKKTLTPRQYRLYRLLREIGEKYLAWKSYDSLTEHFEAMATEFKAEREAMLDALQACSSYGQDVMFEISPRNVAVKGGKLILLDCFFMKSAWRKAWMGGNA